MLVDEGRQTLHQELVDMDALDRCRWPSVPSTALKRQPGCAVTRAHIESGFAAAMRHITSELPGAEQ